MSSSIGKQDLGRLMAFVEVAVAGSFTTAAARMGLSPSALSHSVRALEEDLGVRLLSRTTRSVSPTEAGERLLGGLRPAFETIEREVEALGDLRDRPTGTVRLNAGEHAAQAIIWPKLADFLPDYPDITVEIVVDYGLVDIVADRFDAGVRTGDMLAKDMIAVPISPPMQMAVVATPGYFRGRSEPRVPGDLTSHRCINLRLPTHNQLYAWEFDRKGKSLSVHVDGPLVFNSTTMILDACLAGFGLAYLPESQVRPHLESGAFTRVLADWCETFPGYHLYYPSRRQHSPAFIAVVEALRWRE